MALFTVEFPIILLEYQSHMLQNRAYAHRNLVGTLRKYKLIDNISQMTDLIPLEVSYEIRLFTARSKFSDSIKPGWTKKSPSTIAL